MKTHKALLGLKVLLEGADATTGSHHLLRRELQGSEPENAVIAMVYPEMSNPQEKYRQALEREAGDARDLEMMSADGPRELSHDATNVLAMCTVPCEWGHFSEYSPHCHWCHDYVWNLGFNQIGHYQDFSFTLEAGTTYTIKVERDHIQCAMDPIAYLYHGTDQVLWSDDTYPGECGPYADPYMMIEPTSTSDFTLRVWSFISHEVCPEDDGFLYRVIMDPVPELISVDPSCSAGFITGGGFIISPEGAYASDTTLTGKANFGFVAKGHEGSSNPRGNILFKFKEADLTFKSTSYKSLFIKRSDCVKYWGEGIINRDSVEYGFMLTACDAGEAGADTLRMKIWYMSDETIVYDNKMGTIDESYEGTELSGGSIQVHRQGLRA
eukprot:CAMPEP_0183746042 /NCGR_PEP_ID=MMETSP0737-20130205/66549_1 /TAXON_ID=385413 /ORGANISM="Thalassiosira miniscula, Strain CCMP1093" /LENGTH=381 /DNA_ID=CAMNT_0025981721 /DNA_START=1171 /DNA_END=2316 /DNA_ORIENTATION=-